MRIEFKKPQKTPNNSESPKESTNESMQNKSDSQQIIYDKSGNPITKPELIAEIRRIDSLDIKTAKDKLRRHTIYKYGDNAQPSTVAKAKKNNNLLNKDELTQTQTRTRVTKRTNVNRPQDHLTEDKIKTVIEDIYNGLDPVSACKKNNVTYMKFSKELNKDGFSSLKNEFLNARVTLADNYIFKINTLQDKLLKGEVDACTYSAIARDLMYLAGKFAPATFGDKISIEKTQKVEVNHTIDQNKIASLNKLLALPSNEIEAEFEEV